MTTDETKEINDLANELVTNASSSVLYSTRSRTANWIPRRQTSQTSFNYSLKSLFEKAELELERGVEVEADGDESDQEWRGATFNEEAWAATIQAANQ